MRARFLIPLACALSLVTIPTWADVSDTELSIAARALSFLQHPPTGEIRVGIVYRPGDSASSQEADQLVSLMGSGYRAGSVTLKPVKVKIDEVASANVSLFFLTGGVGSDATTLLQTSTQRSIPCMTTDIPQVQAGRCAMGVRAQPKVQILVNRTAANASGMSFSSVFRIMITEL